MADKDDTGWQRNFERQAGIRRCILLHGDVLDVVRWDNDYLPLIDAIPEMLKRSGFDRVIRWDRFAGVSDAELWRELAAQTAQQPARRTGGTPYGAAAAPATNDPGTAPVSADDFFAVAHHHLVNVGPQRCAFIVDWTQYLFGLDHSLSEEDRQRLLILSKAIRNAPALTDQANRTKPANLLVLVANRLGSVPLGLYQNNPAAQEIVVPPPRRGDREQFVTHNIDKWRLRETLTPTEATFNDFIDALDGLTLRDLQNLIRLSYQLSGDPPTPERLINLYKYGEQRSPWEELNRTKLKTIAASLEQRVKGQSDAIDKVRSVVIRAYTGLSGLQHSKKQKMPKGVLFFVGPTGVGKTELAKSLAEFLYGDEDACIRFDMSEFNHEHSDQRLVGAPPGYLGHQEGGQLTNAVKKRPFSVLLFDEIEKAHVRILDKFLQILEDGRLTDGRGETVFFSETVIIFTSNIGAAEIDVSSNF
jgi:hypothetical protein